MSAAESRLFGPRRPLEEEAADVRALLQEAGVQLALAEAGTGGALARLLCPPTEEAALTRTRQFASAEDLAVALRVSPAKVRTFGAISAMVAAEAAADLIDTYEGGWGLVVMVRNRSDASSVPSTGAGSAGVAADCFIALGAPSATIIEQCHADDVARTVLRLLGQQAQRRLKRR